MDKENGETSDSGTGTNKLSNAPDPASLLDAANIFSAAYWPRTDAANSSSPAGLFAGGTFGPLGPHPSLPFGLIPPTAAAAAAAAAASGRGVPAFPPASNAAYSNTLSVAASQAASLGLPAASAAWWSMASQLAAHDYLARLQASGGLNFPPLSSPGELPYSSLGLPGLPHHKSSKGSSKTSSLSKGSGSSKGKSSATALSLQAGAKLDGRLDPSKPQQPVQQQPPLPPLSHPNNVPLYGKSAPSRSSAKTSSSLTIQPSVPKAPVKKPPSLPSPKPPPSLPPPATIAAAASSSIDKQPLPLSLPKSSTPKSTHQPPSSSIFTSPLSLVSNSERSSAAHTTSTTQSIVNSTISSGIAPNILSDPSSILGGVRLPPDTEIIKYTSSIVGPKIPGTTNRGRKKTISLDPPSVSVMPTHSSTGMLIDRGTKWPKMNEPQDLSTTNDRVEVIKLPATNGSPSGINIPAYGTGGSGSDPSNDAPLNLSLKPASTSVSTNCQSNSLNSLSTLSANIGSDRISRRKPGPKPRRVIQSPSQLSGTAPGAPSASLTQLFAAADSPRPPSRSEDSEPTPLPPPQVNVQPPAITTITTTISSNISSSSSSSSSSGGGSGGGGVGPPAIPPVSGASSPAPAGAHQPNHKDGRPRNLGRGVSKPKKNTVASLLAQSRALGIKPMQIDPNTPMNQQISMLKSNMLAAQQYMADSMDDKHLEKLRGALSDSSNMEVSTDSDNLTDSNPTDSEAETDANGVSNPKKRRHFNERELRLPLDQGWKRETIIRGLTKNGGIKGDVCYTPPDTNNKLKHISDIIQYLEQSGMTDLTKENFTFSCKIILGEYLQKPPPGATSEGEYLRMSEEDVTKRLDDLRSSARTTLGVEQRIEVARRQQAARAAARHDREQARAARDLEKTEKQEAARRDREARSHQLLEARRKRHEELNRQRLEEQQRKLQEREMKKQQAALIKEQEKERRRQHMALVRALEARRRLEERERKKQQAILEKQASKERRMEQRRIDLEILTELRKPCEDLELSQKPLPDYQRIPGLRLSGQAFADILMVFEFLHNFGETLGFDMDSLPCLDSLQQALLNESTDAEEELLSVMTHLLVCAIEDPGIPNPARHTTILGQSLRQADITHSNLSEILRIYLYANATGEVKALTGVHFERDREKRVADHYQNCAEMQHTQGGKNAAYYELLHENTTWRMSDSLKDKPFLALSPTDKAAMLAFLCNELLQNKAVIRQVEGSLETVTQLRKDRWLLDTKIRKLRMLLSRKLRAEAAERMQAQLKEGGALDGSVTTGDTTPRAVDSPAPTPTPHKDDLLVDEEDEISENESEGTQPEEEEDKKLSSEELTKKLEKLIKASETQLQSLNTSAHQLRATCYGQDRYWRRYWSLPTAGGVFIEAMESAQPEVYHEQLREAECAAIKLQNISDIIPEPDTAQDPLTDCEVSQIVANELDTNEHRKTPNRLGETPNANNTTTTNEEFVGTVDETIFSGSGAVSSVAVNCNDMNETEPVGVVKSEPDDIEEQIPGKLVQKTVANVTTTSTVVKGYSLFEKLGECMEKENKTETDTSDIKVKQLQTPSITSAIGECHVGPIVDDKDSSVIEVKSETKIEPKMETDEEKGAGTLIGATGLDSDVKWFSIVARDGNSCEGVNMTAGNRWDTNIVGVCTRDSVAELKIPVFPPPNCGSGYVPCGPCDSPGPLQMSAEESAQLEYIKVHGPPARLEACLVPAEMRTGWWRVSDPDQLRAALDAMHARGVRERELKRTFQLTMQSMYESATHVHIEEGQRAAADLNDCPEGSRIMLEKAASVADKPGAWNPAVATRVDFSVLEQVEALEDKVANASMQVKGWKVPNRDSDEVVLPGEAVPLAKERLAALEAAIERRYLKPPLGISTGDVNLAAIAQEACGLNSSTSSSSTAATSSLSSSSSSSAAAATTAGSGATSSSANSSTAQQSAHSQSGQSQSATGQPDSNTTSSGTCSSAAASPPAEDIPKGLVVWRDAVQRSQTSAQLAMCLYMLESCIAWDKSIMKANCQFCHSGDNEDKLLLCDSCDKGYHTYCFRPKMETIPEGNWYCHECINKVTGERNCIVCGKKQSTGKLILCDLCPRAYHQDCLTPPLAKVPRGKWYCPNCHSKQPKKRNSRRSNNKAARDSESSDHPPSSPAPSHSSVTTNEDANNQPSVAANNSRDAPPNPNTQPNASPSTSAPRKDRISKKLQKELAPCKALLEDLECHDDAWPFLLPVNTKQFPTYRKIITSPMDLSTIKKRLQDLHYKSREEFCMDVRQIFDNCETFNEDDSPVGKAGHCMRQFFEARWNELCPPHLNKS